jgi:AAA family ATP:ADP antiporter
LELSAAGAKTNDHYLARRAKNQWWTTPGGAPRFPQVPGDDFAALERVVLAADGGPASLWGKALPLGALFFCASFNLTILQNLKDAILVTAAGAEALPYLALGALPASVGFFVYYRALPKAIAFYAALAPLVASYALFALVLYPAAATLHPIGLTASLAATVPAGLHGLLKAAEFWTFSLFHCIAELWGGVTIAVLFWGLANEVCSLDEAKTVYPLMGVAANIALVLAGTFVKAVNAWAAGAGGEGAALRALVGTVAAGAAAMCGLKAWIDARVPRPPPDPKKAAKDAAKKAAKAAAAGGGAAKGGGGLSSSLAALRASPTVSSLAALVVGYGVSHRLFEYAWKAQLRALHPSALAYQVRGGEGRGGRARGEAAAAGPNAAPHPHRARACWPTSASRPGT